MWVHVPRECYQSAPEPVDLTLASDWLPQMLAQSVMWKGTLSPARTWAQRLKQGTWMTRLFGQTLPPSTASRGVERWIGLLADSPASRTALRGCRPEPRTKETCGPMSTGLSEKSNQTSLSWKTFRESVGITLTESGQTFEEWDTGLRKDCLRRQKLAPLTSASDSSHWHTPIASPSVSEGGEWKGRYYVKQNGKKSSSHLTHQTANWRTPTAMDKNSPWQQATVGDSKKRRLRDDAAHWPTPRYNDWKGGGANTPINGYLDRTAEVWRDYLPSLPVQVTARDGHTCSPKCRRLNPRFAEWLMGWPLGWTGLAESEAAGLDLLETEWCHWWQRMRFEFSRISP